nr:PREDICTED: uncharacterized protein LOC105662235 [Megachile rotundata]
MIISSCVAQCLIKHIHVPHRAGGKMSIKILNNIGAVLKRLIAFLCHDITKGISSAPMCHFLTSSAFYNIMKRKQYNNEYLPSHSNKNDGNLYCLTMSGVETFIYYIKPRLYSAKEGLQPCLISSSSTFAVTEK